MSVQPEPKAKQDKYKLDKLKQWKCEEAMKNFLDHIFRGSDHLINIKKITQHTLRMKVTMN